MKAWLLNQLGGLQNLELTETPDPTPAPGEVVLQLHYAGLNPADRYLAEGQYPARPPFPHILGRDGIGEVIAVAPDVTSVRTGDKRVLLRSEIGVGRPGTFAERVAVPADALVPVPEGWSDEQAAGAPLVYLTAYQALMQWGDLPPSVVLITGASGGVGTASIQLAKAMGHTVVALSRSQSKRDQLKSLGADLALDPDNTQWRRNLKEFLGERRVDLAIDSVGGSLLSEVINVLGMWGKVSVVGRVAGPTPQFNSATLFFRRIRLGGVAVGSYTRDESHAAWQAIVSFLNRSGSRPLVDSVHPFDELVPAFEALARGPMGKVLLNVGYIRGTGF